MTRTLPIDKHFAVAALLARDVPVAEIARQFQVTRKTIYNWSRTGEAQAHVATIKAGVAEATKHLAIADKVRRIEYAQTMRDGVDALIAARAQKHWSGYVVGAETGQVAVKVTETTTRSGNQLVTYEAAFDAALHEQARKWNEYAAKELGQLDEHLTIRHRGRVDHVVRRPDLAMLSDEELESLLPLAEKIAAGGID